MKVHPFVEAEKVAGHSVNNACRLLEVSRSAFYSRSSNPPSKRAVTDAELLKGSGPFTPIPRAPMDHRGSIRSLDTATLPAAGVE
jgi:hypothetical protein